MPCEPIKFGDGGYVMLCGRGPVQRCKFCGKTCTKLCDFPVGKKTCDAKMCDECATQVGEDRDYCPSHNRQGTLL